MQIRDGVRERKNRERVDAIVCDLCDRIRLMPIMIVIVILILFLDLFLTTGIMLFKPTIVDLYILNLKTNACN